MAWSKPYSAEFEEQVLRQLVALIYRDQGEALASVGVSETFKEFDLALVPIVNWPAILVIPAVSEFDPEAMLTRKQWMNFRVVLSVTHQDRNRLTLLAMRYVKAVHWLLDAISPGDWHAQLPLPASPFGEGAVASIDRSVTNVQRLFVVAHEWGVALRAASGIFAVAVDLPVRIEVEEN